MNQPAIWRWNSKDEFTPERFTIDDDEKAQWAVGKLNAIDEEIQRVKAQAETMLKRLERDRADFLERFEDDLRAWLTTKLEGGTKRSVDLLTGRIGFRKKPGGLKVVDKDAAFDWCIKNAPPDLDLIRETVTYSVDKEQLKALHASTGEIPSGCEVAEDSDTLYVRGGK